MVEGLKVVVAAFEVCEFGDFRGSGLTVLSLMFKIGDACTGSQITKSQQTLSHPKP